MHDQASLGLDAYVDSQSIAIAISISIIIHFEIS